MPTDHEVQVQSLIESINNFSGISGANTCSSVESNSMILLHWIKHLTSYHLTGTADDLILAVGSSLREVAGSLSLGIIRPALFSLRSQIDLVLTWIYFKDHPVEWKYVNDSGDGFKMKKELITYLGVYHKFYGTRFGILNSIAKRKEDEPYRFLSAHIHGQSVAVLSNANNLSDLVRPSSECNECIEAVYAVAEYLNDVLLAIYADNWISLPEEIRTSAESRFISAEQRVAFFATTKLQK